MVTVLEISNDLFQVVSHPQPFGDACINDMEWILLGSVPALGVGVISLIFLSRKVFLTYSYWNVIKYSLYIILWDTIARPHRKPFALFYPLETCFFRRIFSSKTLHPGKIYSVKIIEKSLEKSEKLRFFYFCFRYFECVTFTHPYWPTVNQKGKTCF